VAVQYVADAFTVRRFDHSLPALIFGPSALCVDGSAFNY
jgi:hypothetical protein